MLVVLLSWIYISILCTLAGIGILSFAKNIRYSWIHYIVAGIVAITVYVEFFSIFAKIGCFAHIILLTGALSIGYLKRQEIRTLWSKYSPVLCSWEGFFYICFIIFIAFFTSRGEFHTDTNIYHAAAIRLYEEYGLIKGAGNLQLHYAYNSSYLAFASIFSLNWLFGRSLHTTTGFMEIIMCLYAFRGLKDFKRHEDHVADMMKVGILFYALVNTTRIMSPATDYAAMFVVLFVIAEWCDNLHEKENETIFALLSLAAVYVTTIKFSACLLVLIAIYPAVCLIKKKKWKEIAGYVLCGCVILVPFLIRNYFISGWLLYPFDGIDIFQAEWKVPRQYMLVDANQIKVWGRCLYDVEKTDWPLSKWFPIWWSHQARYERMFLGGTALAAVLQFVIVLKRIIKKQELRLHMAVLHLAVWGNLILWFFMAPFIRYGLAFLFAVIMIAAGEYLNEKKSGFYSILTGGFVFCIFVSVSPYWDQYITDAGVFVKHSLTDPYYILQKDYDVCEMDNYEINGNTVYYSVEGEINNYHVYPATCYGWMLERSTLIGDDIKDGFMAK
ncbi:MAG: hypothetical protein OSJ53_06485 [Kineothrix sp.]|nr:hypothetical protein [Kineothrix sp.]